MILLGYRWDTAGHGAAAVVAWADWVHTHTRTHTQHSSTRPAPVLPLPFPQIQWLQQSEEAWPLQQEVEVEVDAAYRWGRAGGWGLR